MSLPPTTNLGLVLPTPDVDPGWGYTLNTAFNVIDNVFSSNGTGTSVGVNIGSGKTLAIGGTMILGGSDNTATPTAATIRGAKVAAGTTDATGPDMTVYASNGTGTGGSGAIILRIAPPASTSGSGINSFRTGLYIKNTGSVGINSNVAPDGVLDVKGSNTATAESWAYLRAGNTSGVVPTFANPIASGNGIAIGHNYAGNKEADIVWDQTQNSTQYMAIYKSDGTTATEQLRLNSSGAIGLAGANYGSAGQVLTSGGASGVPTWTSTSSITQGTSVKTVAGGNTFTGIPSTAKMIILSFYGISAVSGGSPQDILVTIGPGTTPVTTGYQSSGAWMSSASRAVNPSTSGFIINTNPSASVYTFSGTMRLTKVSSPTGYLWVSDHTYGSTTGDYTGLGGGNITLSGDLGCVKIAAETGSLTTAGTVNITYM